MKRFALLFLLAVLPLQFAWSAGVAHCPRDSGDGDHASAHGGASGAAHAHVHVGDDGDDGNEGHGAGSGLDCSVFHFVALEPLAARAPSLPGTGATAHHVDDPGFESHVPDGLDRPNWRLVA